MKYSQLIRLYTRAFPIALIGVLFLYSQLIGGDFLIDNAVTVLGILVIAVQIITIESLLEKRFDRLEKLISTGNPNAVFNLGNEITGISKLIHNAKKDILWVSSNPLSFLSTESPTIIQALSRGIRVRVVLVDYNDRELLNYTVKQSNSNIDEQTLRNNVNMALQQLARITELSQEGTLEVRLINHSPQLSGLISDDTMLIDLQKSNKYGFSETVYFSLDRNVSSDLFEYFSHVLIATWEAALPIKGELNDRTSLNN